MAVNTVPSLNATLDTFLWVQYCHLIPLMHSATTFLCRVRLRFGLDPTDRFWRCDAVPLTSYIIGSCTFQPFSTMRCSKSWQHIDRFLTIFDYEMFKKLAKHNRVSFFLMFFLTCFLRDDSVMIVGMLRNITSVFWIHRCTDLHQTILVEDRPWFSCGRGHADCDLDGEMGLWII